MPKLQDRFYRINNQYLLNPNDMTNIKIEKFDEDYEVNSYYIDSDYGTKLYSGTFEECEKFLSGLYEDNLKEFQRKPNSSVKSKVNNQFYKVNENLLLNLDTVDFIQINNKRPYSVDVYYDERKETERFERICEGILEKCYEDFFDFGTAMNARFNAIHDEDYQLKEPWKDIENQFIKSNVDCLLNLKTIISIKVEESMEEDPDYAVHAYCSGKHSPELLYDGTLEECQKFLLGCYHGSCKREEKYQMANKKETPEPENKEIPENKKLNWETSREKLEEFRDHLEEICRFESIPIERLLKAMVDSIGKDRFVYLMYCKYCDDKISKELLDWWKEHWDDGEPGMIYKHLT